MKTATRRLVNSDFVPCWQAKACPFCGWVPSIQPLRGNVVLACNYAGCGPRPSIIRASLRSALAGWNRRVPRTDRVARSQDNALIREARTREARA